MADETRASSRTRTVIRILAALLIGLALLAAAPPPAHAQDEEAARARAAFDRGTRRFTARRYEQALDAFQEAYSLAPHPAVLFNIASCYDKLDRSTEAVNTYQRYLRERGDDVEPSRRRDVNAALARLGRDVALLRISLPEPNAPVTLDGQPIEVGEDPLAVSPGTYVIASIASDGREAREEIAAVAGETADVTLSYPAPAIEPGGNGHGGEGEGEGEGPDGGPGMPRGSHGWSPSLRWVGIGATVVLAGGWAYTGLRALSLNSDYEKSPDQATRDEGLTYRVLADFVFLPATILAAGFTVLAFVLADGGEEESGPRELGLVVLPLLARDAAGVGVSGAF